MQRLSDTERLENIQWRCSLQIPVRFDSWTPNQEWVVEIQLAMELKQTAAAQPGQSPSQIMRDEFRRCQYFRSESSVWMRSLIEGHEERALSWCSFQPTLLQEKCLMYDSREVEDEEGVEC